MTTCQCGTERFLKQEVTDSYHDLRAAFSRPGFVTFKATGDWDAKRVGKMRSIFARYRGLSLGKVQCGDVDDFGNVSDAATRVWETAKEIRVDRLHVFPRDLAMPGTDDFEPRLDANCAKIHNILYQQCPYREKLSAGAAEYLLPAERKETVLDIALVSPTEWYIGYHFADHWRTLQPGGIADVVRPIDAVSRAYLKFEEALRWSEFPVKLGSRWLDIGAAPGGASQALLARGAEVFAVDPAEMAPPLYKNPNLFHLRGRLNQIKCSSYRKARWVVTDMNVAPNYTLDVLEDCVLRKDMKIQGLLFTLKLLKWDLIADIPSYVQRIKNWGYGKIALKQMQFNRQEIMVAVKKS